MMEWIPKEVLDFVECVKKTRNLNRKRRRETKIKLKAEEMGKRMDLMRKLINREMNVTAMYFDKFITAT